jgi:hypothetical protein
MVLIVCRVPLRWQLLRISANWLSILTFLHPRDELQLVTVVLGEESLQYGSELLAPFLPADQQQQQGPTITPVVSVDSTLQKCSHAAAINGYRRGRLHAMIMHLLHSTFVMIAATANMQEPQQARPAAPPRGRGHPCSVQHSYVLRAADTMHGMHIA